MSGQMGDELDGAQELVRMSGNGIFRNDTASDGDGIEFGKEKRSKPNRQLQKSTSSRSGHRI